MTEAPKRTRKVRTIEEKIAEAEATLQKLKAQESVKAQKRIESLYTKREAVLIRYEKALDQLKEIDDELEELYKVPGVEVAD